MEIDYMNDEKDLIQTEEVEEKETNALQETESFEEPKESKTLGDFMTKAVDTIQKKVAAKSETMDYNQGLKEITNIAVTAKALDENNPENDEFLGNIKKIKQTELEQAFLSEQFKAEAAKYAAKQTKAEAFYTNFRPILEFDFSHLIPKTKKNTLFKHKPKTDKRGNVINPPVEETKEEFVQNKAEITYKDRSYGIPLMVLMLCLLTLPYCVVSIILALANGINAIFDGIARFGKPALLICGSIMCIIIMILVVYGALMGIDALFGTHILNSVGL